jgi:hypothetical protein
MTQLRHTPSVPGDRARRVFEISGDALTLAREFFHAQAVACVVTGQAENAATWTRHLVRACRRIQRSAR